MLEKRHNTHALSSNNSSSNNHSYEFDNGNKKEKHERSSSLKDNNILISKNQLNKINDILYKYNLISDENSDKENKIKSKIKKIPSNGDIQPYQTPKKKKRKKNNNSFINALNSDNKEKNKNKDKTEFINEEQKNDDYLKNKFSETKNPNNKIKKYLSYKIKSKEPIFNNIKEFKEEEKKAQNEEKKALKEEIKKVHYYHIIELAIQEIY